MRFLSIYRPGTDGGAPPTEKEMADMGKLIEDWMRAGTLIDTGGLLPSALGSHVSYDGGKLSVVDGPFTEAKEVIGGYAILEAKSKAHAIELAKEFLKFTGHGKCEVRQMWEA